MQEGLAEGRVATDQLDRPNGYSGRAHVHEDEADACVLRGVGVRADEQKHPVRLVGVSRPDLLAVDEEVVAVGDRARLQAREIRPRAGLRVSLTPADLAADDRRQVLALLLLAALVQQQRSDHRQSETGEGGAKLQAAHFVVQNLRLGG